VRIEQISPVGREGQSALAVAQVNQVDEPLIVEVLKGVVRNVEIVFGDHPKCTDDSQRAAVFAVELVDSLAIDNQLSLVATRQVEVAHKGFPRIVFITVAWVVHARPFVAAIPRVILARIVPSSVGHRSSLLECCGCVVRENVPAVAARASSRRRRSAGACSRGVQGAVCGNQRAPSPEGAKSVGSAHRREEHDGRQPTEDCLEPLYRDRVNPANGSKQVKNHA
jgi:hypothetical protein